jgi:divalent metal cation (Fe/Co/Zn/Cd) transporter
MSNLQIGLGSVLTPARRAALVRRVRLLVLATVTYNVIEAVIALTAGAAASSSALIGFGLDSVVEVSSALAVAWQFSGPNHEDRERVALRVIAVSFFALAAFVSYDAVGSLVTSSAADQSTVGITLAAVSLSVMPFLSFAQRRAGRELGSNSAVADSKQTLLCTYMSAVLLVGLVLNSAVGWWWADPIAALVIAAIAVREGLEAWRGDRCCAPTAALFERSDREVPAAGGCADECCSAEDVTLTVGDRRA